LLLEAIDNADDADNPETFHALFDHPERGLDTNDDTQSVGGDAITIIVAVDTLRREFEVITRWRQ
jgi:hypothetical protein